MELIYAFIRAIPVAAASPLALIAYLATLAAWTFIAYRVKRFDILMKNIKDLPEKDRRAVIESEMRNARIPPEMTAENYLKEQRQNYMFYAFLAACAVAVLLFAITTYKTFDMRQRSDNHIGVLLGREQSPSANQSQFRSSINTLINGPTMIREAVAELRPPPSQQQLSEATNRYVQREIRDPKRIIEMLNEEFQGGGRIQDVSAALNGAVANIDKAFNPLAECYRNVECANGSRIDELCEIVTRLLSLIETINTAAQKIPGVTFNTTRSKPLFGDGPMDLYFNQLSSENLTFLESGACKGR